MPLYVIRFFKYMLTGGSTFLLDLCLLWLLTDVFRWHYLFAASISFLIAITLNYWLARRFVFDTTLRGVHEGYVIFIGIALLGMLIVAGGMYALVEYLGWWYFSARIAVASVAGLWNYLLNLYVNFKVDK